MLKTLTIAAIAATAVSAFAQDNMMTIDAKGAKKKELISFVNRDAYKKLSAPDAYILTSFIASLPGNYETALVRSLAANAEESYNMRMEMQMSANSMGPMGDSMPMQESGFKNFQSGVRSFEDIEKDPMARLSYEDAVVLLQKIHGPTDRGLIDYLFHPVSFTKSQVNTYTNERVLDAIERYIKANAMATKPVRLKYTSLAPHTYAGLPSDWSSKPWPAGS